MMVLRDARTTMGLAYTTHVSAAVKRPAMGTDDY
jgi:hypothetical protein